MKTATLAVTLLLIALVPSRANFLGPEFCAAQFHVAKLEREAGFRTNEIIIRDRRTQQVKTWREKKTRTEWVSCMCAQHSQSCDCCAYDIAKACAEIERRNAVTANVLRVSPCEEGQR